MPREIKTTLAVDGEQAFKRAINDARTSMRNLGTQLTLAAAEFKKDGDAMKLMETRSKTLKAEITQQEEIVKALETAVEESTKAYGENSDKTEKWQAELNRARASLTNLQSELTLNDAGLDRNGNSFDTSSQKAADYQATLQTIGKNVSFETVTQGISNITDKFENAIKKVFNFAKTIRETFADAGTWADDLITQATTSGMDVENMQRWNYAATIIDTDADTIIKARDKLGQKMVKGWTEGSGDDKLNVWDLLGVDITDKDTGAMRDTMDVLWDLGETLMNMTIIDGNDVRANEYAMEAFGKSWRELLPLFTAGRAEWDKALQDADVVSEDRVKALGELDDANQALANSWDTTKYSFLAELAPTITDVTKAVTEMLQAFNEWMDTDEGKKSMEELSAAIQELFSGVSDIKFSDVINSVKDAINGIKDALVWLSENKDGVYTALEVIGAGFALLKISDTVLKFLQLKNGLSGLIGNGGNQMDQSQAGRPGGSYNYTGGSDTGSTAGGGALGFILAKALPVALGAGIVVADSLNNHGSNDLINSEGQLTDDFWASVLGGYDDSFNSFMESLEARYGKDYNDYSAAAVKGGTYGRSWALTDEQKQAVVDAYLNGGAAEDSFRILEEQYGWKTSGGIPSYTEAQRAAAEEFWDTYRKSPDDVDSWSDSFDRLEASFNGNEEAFGKLMDAIDLWETQNNEDNSVYGVEDLPKELWDAGDQIGSAVGETLQNMTGGAALPSGGDIQAFKAVPGQMEAAVRTAIASGMSGIRVTMDGATVGALILPYINTGLGGLVG